MLVRPLPDPLPALVLGQARRELAFAEGGTWTMLEASAKQQRDSETDDGWVRVGSVRPERGATVHTVRDVWLHPATGAARLTRR